jgi:Tfp pilus assembly protein PilE
VIERLRREEGFGLIELITALVILNVAIFAMFAMFNAGVLSIARASRTTTGSILAEKQMEMYRSLGYDDVGLHVGEIASSATDTTHTSDADWISQTAQVSVAGCNASLDRCKAVRTNVSGPDGHLYRIDTYVHTTTPTSGRAVKQVTVIVRRQETSQVLADLTATFDQLTGCVYNSATGVCS